MFKIQECSRRVGTVGIHQATFKARDHVTSKIAQGRPFSLVDLNTIEADTLLILAKLSTIKDVEKLVAFRLVGCPIVNHKTLDVPVEPQFFTDFTFAELGLDRNVKPQFFTDFTFAG